jgi:glutathione S-transferase
MMHELNLKVDVDYELKVLSFPPRAYQREFLKENALGTVPLLIDRSLGEELKMTESSAMCQYLASKYSTDSVNLDVAPTSPQYGNYLNFLHQADATLTWPQVLILRYEHFETDERKKLDVSEDYKKWFHSRLKGSIEARLNKEHGVHGEDSGGPYLVDNRFTAADVAVGFALQLGEHLGLSEDYPPQVASYWGRLRERESFKTANAEQFELGRAQGVEPTAPFL